MKSVRIFGFGVAVALVSGCGVANSTSSILKAQAEYRQAVEAEAAKKAPYEFTLGEEFLRKAWEEAGYSDYQSADDLAAKAFSYLREALRLSSDNSMEDSTLQDAPRE